MIANNTLGEQHVGRTAKVHERLCGSRHSLRSALRSPMRTNQTLTIERPMTALIDSLRGAEASLEMRDRQNGNADFDFDRLAMP